MAQKPSIPAGTRDFSPAEMVRRNYIFDSIEKIFQRYGFQPIETPAMETLQTLLGKYGDEGDKLLFRVLNSGDFLAKVPEEIRNQYDSQSLSSAISEKGLRYDLTVPFARYVVQNRGKLHFPFKRYQIQPVWRADRPQKGRYREFYQCDVDVIGSNSLLNEVELVQIVDEVFRKLQINCVIKINNRKLLAGIAEKIGHVDKMVDMTVAIDKLDKIGLEKVNNELRQKGFSSQAVEQLQPVLELSGSTEEKIAYLRKLLSASEVGEKGIEEVQTIFGYFSELKIQTPLELDLSLARGLNYYTGAIFEVKALDVKIGSICGGGRYDDLTGIFGLKDVSGVGVSFGADRIYDVMSRLDLFPENTGSTTKLLFVNFGKKEEHYCLKLLKKVRNEGINAEIYPESAKMKKQMSYADRKNIPFVALIGESEMAEETISLKNMVSGEQNTLSLKELIEAVKKTD